MHSDADRYTAGGGSISANVEQIDLSWIDGKVDIAYHDGADILLAERTAATLENSEKLHYLVDGDTLYIKYAAYAAKLGKNLNKTLQLSLPREIALGKVTVNVVSANVQVHELAAPEVVIQTVSGAAEGLFRQADEVTISTQILSGSVCC